MLLDAKNHHWRALQALEKSGRSPTPQLYVNLGNTLDTSGRVFEAIRCYDRALEIEPGFGMAHLNRARALTTLNHLSETYSITMLLQEERHFETAIADERIGRAALRYPLPMAYPGKGAPRETLARWLADARAAVAFTGAGISTDSGVPDFRSPQGIWSKYQPVYYDEFMASAASRKEYWRQKGEGHGDFAAAKPNRSHEILAEWEAEERLLGVITQNIDGLHQDAGSRLVHEIHGTHRWIACQDCGHRSEAEPWIQHFLGTGEPPRCPECGEDRMKHATISFGQTLDRDVLDACVDLAERSDLFLALGSSLVVHPAASLPRIAKESGARLVIVNREPTPLDPWADLVFHEGIADVLEGVR